MNNLEKDFVPYSESMELKELGFDEPCIKQWTYAPVLIFCTNAWGHPKLKTNKESHSDSGGDCISAPTYSQAFRWFRENYNLDSEIYMNHEYGSKFYTYLVLQLDRAIISHLSGATGKSPEHEEAELECLRKLIEIVKNK